MPSDTWKIGGSIFHVFCLVATVSVIVYWVYMFSLNEDTSLVKYKYYYEEEQDVFPSLSLCFNNPFSDKKLGQAITGLNRTTYFQFLNGEYLSPEIMAINYESITMNISDSIINYWAAFHDGSSQYYEADYMRFLNSFNGFRRNTFYGCYRLPIPDDKNIEYFSVQLKNDIFPDGRRPSLFDFFTLIHYPNQLLTSLGSIRDRWQEPLTNNTYAMRFAVDKVETIQRRNKITKPCDENWNNYDDGVLAEHTRKLGCRAPYQEIGEEIQLCSTKSEMKKARFSLRSDLNGMLPPCKALQKVIYDYTESDISTTDWGGTNSVWIGLIFLDPHFMETTQTRAIDSQTLIGNIGGYIGLC